MYSIARAVWRRLVSLVGTRRCKSCGKSMRLLHMTDLSPEEIRTRRLNGTLDGLLDSAYVCKGCMTPGDWTLIE